VKQRVAQDTDQVSVGEIGGGRFTGGARRRRRRRVYSRRRKVYPELTQ